MITVKLIGGPYDKGRTKIPKLVDWITLRTRAGSPALYMLTPAGYEYRPGGDPAQFAPPGTEASTYAEYVASINGGDDDDDDDQVEGDDDDEADDDELAAHESYDVVPDMMEAVRKACVVAFVAGAGVAVVSAAVLAFVTSAVGG